jgi:hypothetical protein
MKGLSVTTNGTKQLNELRELNVTLGDVRAALCDLVRLTGTLVSQNREAQAEWRAARAAACDAVLRLGRAEAAYREAWDVVADG